MKVTRNDLIVEMRAHGETYSAIAEKFGITKERVRQIIVEEKHKERLRMMFPKWGDTRLKYACARARITDEKTLVKYLEVNHKIRSVGKAGMNLLLYGQIEIDGKKYSLTKETRTEIIEILGLAQLCKCYTR